MSDIKYFDHAATTKAHEEVFEAMKPFFASLLAMLLPFTAWASSQELQ